MAEINTITYEQARAAWPATAIIQITLEDGSTDTIRLNPRWAAMLAKRIRQGGSSVIRLHGCLPEGSPESPTAARYMLENDGGLCELGWRGWLLGKPEVQA